VQRLITPFETFTMANFNATLDTVLSKVPTFGWPIVHVGQPIFEFMRPFQSAQYFGKFVGFLSSLI